MALEKKISILSIFCRFEQFCLFWFSERNDFNLDQCAVWVGAQELRGGACIFLEMSSIVEKLAPSEIFKPQSEIAIKSGDQKYVQAKKLLCKFRKKNRAKVEQMLKEFIQQQENVEIYGQQGLPIGWFQQWPKDGAESVLLHKSSNKSSNILLHKPLSALSFGN